MLHILVSVLFNDGRFPEFYLHLISAMTNQQLMDHGNQMMDETDQAIERSKKVCYCPVT